MQSAKPILLVSGLGNGVGVGGAVARLWSQDGYRVGLISRPRKDIDELCKELNSQGGEAAVFSVDSYDHACLASVFKQVKAKWPESRLKTAVWNTSQWSNIPFLDIKESDIKLSTQINIVSATAFAQEAIRAFIEPVASEHDSVGGTLIITGATSATRGASKFGSFAAGKGGLRNLSQSIAREYGPAGVHVAFVIVDGTIKTKATERLFGARNGQDWLSDPSLAVQPLSVAKCYKYLHEQDPSAWTLEMDLRPAKEKF